MEEEEESWITPDLYEGQKELSKPTKNIGKLSRSYLQSVLTFHALFAACSRKDELILHVGLIADQRAHLCFNREQKMFLDLIAVTKELILAKKKSLCSGAPTYKQRTFETPTVTTLSSHRPRYHAAAQSLQERHVWTYLKEPSRKILTRFLMIWQSKLKTCLLYWKVFFCRRPHSKQRSCLIGHLLFIVISTWGLFFSVQLVQLIEKCKHFLSL